MLHMRVWKSHLWINQLLDVRCLSIAFVLRSKLFWFIKFYTYISIPARDLIVTPCSVAVMLRSDIQRHSKAESNPTMLQSAGMFVSDQIADKSFISLVKFALFDTKRDTSAANNC